MSISSSLSSPTPQNPNHPPPQNTAISRPIILALSGPSSSGKTTLATVLAALLPPCHIFHLDDFYLPERQLPLRAGVPDWDSAASFDLDALRICCERWKAGEVIDVVKSVVGKGGGEANEEAGRGEGAEGGEGEGQARGAESKEEAWSGDGVHGGTMPAQGSPTRERLERVMARLKHSPLAISGGLGGVVLPPPSPPPPSLRDLTGPRHHRLLILDGILLHTPAFAALQPLFDIKILLRASFAEARRRREARGGYVTLEGFWQDPEGYFEEVVWRSYQEGHAGFFRDGDVEGQVLRKEGEGNGDMMNGVWIQPLGMDLAQGLEWVWKVLEMEMGEGRLSGWDGG